MFKALTFRKNQEKPKGLKASKEASKEQNDKNAFLFSVSLSHPALSEEAKNKIKESIVKELIKNKWDKGSHTPLTPFGGSLYRRFYFHVCIIIC